MFDKLIGDVMGRLGGAQGDDAMGKLLGMVTGKDSGGLHGLVQQFTSQGLGSIIRSWVGTGANEPITADQMQRVLGQGKIGEIAQKLGISTEQASSQLAQWLPKIVDGLTPNGRIEERPPKQEEQP